MKMIAILNCNSQVKGLCIFGKIFFLLLIFLCGCIRSKTNIELYPPQNEPLTGSVLGYGVVIAQFVHIRAEPGDGGDLTGYLRKGALVKVLERRNINDNDSLASWLLVNEDEGPILGWINERFIEVYDNRNRAITASSLL